MPHGPGCRCKPQDRGLWRIVHYKCNFSAFNGHRWTPSDYSLIACDGCGARWRTKAKYVERLTS